MRRRTRSRWMLAPSEGSTFHDEDLLVGALTESSRNCAVLHGKCRRLRMWGEDSAVKSTRRYCPNHYDDLSIFNYIFAERVHLREGACYEKHIRRTAATTVHMILPLHTSINMVVSVWSSAVHVREHTTVLFAQSTTRSDAKEKKA